MRNETTNFAAEDLNKDDLASALTILLDMTGFEGQLKKMSLPALRKMYQGVNHNAIQVSQVVREAREARKDLRIMEERVKSFERDERRNNKTRVA